MARIKSQERETRSCTDSLEQQKNPPHRKVFWLELLVELAFLLLGVSYTWLFLLHFYILKTWSHPLIQIAWEWRCLALAFHCMFPLSVLWCQSDSNGESVGWNVSDLLVGLVFPVGWPGEKLNSFRKSVSCNLNILKGWGRLQYLCVSFLPTKKKREAIWSTLHPIGQWIR